MRIWLSCFVVLVVFEPGVGLGIDFARVPDWGPPTLADTLHVRMRDARWLEDAATFQAVRDSFWALYPHHDTVLSETVKWHRDQQGIAPLRQAIATGQVEAFTGLRGLSNSDLALVTGLTCAGAGLYDSAATCFARVLDVAPTRPSALAERAWLAPFLLWERAEQDAALEAALASPEAAVSTLEHMATLSPNDPRFGYRSAAMARIRALPPRPQLVGALAIQGLFDLLFAPGLTPDRLAAELDELHARHPALMNVYLDDVLSNGLVWLEPDELQVVLEARADWLTPRELARCRALLFGAEDCTYEAYRALMTPVRESGQPPEHQILYDAADWHPNAAETEAWARRLAAESLQTNWRQAAQILPGPG